MHVTPFGWLFLPIVIGILARRRDWLPGLLIVAACLHAPAVFVIGGADGERAFGITPWLVVSFAIFLHLCALVHRDGLQPLRSADRTTLRLLAGWMLFAVLGIVSAFTLPFLFEGIPTYDSLDELNISVGTKPLEWSLSNVAQAFNLAVVAMLFVYGAYARPFSRTPNALLNALVAAAAIALAFSLLQRALLWAGSADHWLVTDSLNPGYRQVIGYLFARDGFRMGWPFSEPSYASAWFAALFVAGLAVWLHGSPAARHRTGMPLLLISGIGSLNSFSGTGIATIVACCGALAVVELVRCIRDSLHGDFVRLKRMLRLTSMFGLALLAIYVATSRVELSHPSWGSRTVPTAVAEYLRYKINDHKRTDMSRTRSNAHAMEVVVTSHGLGVGLGSNRASSYVLSLGSTIGITGCLLLSILIATQLCNLRLPGKDRDVMHVLQAGTLSMFVALTLAISDPIWPAWWIWLLASFWSGSSAIDDESRRTKSTLIARA